MALKSSVPLVDEPTGISLVKKDGRMSWGEANAKFLLGLHPETAKKMDELFPR